MARIKFSSLVSQVTGSIGGLTFQRGQFGNVIRSKPIGIKSKSMLQLDRRAIMQSIHTAWSVLDDANRKKWKQFIFYSGQTIAADTNILLSGYNLFIKYQFCRLLYNLPLLSAFVYVPLPTLPQSFIVYPFGSKLYIQFDIELQYSSYFFILKISNQRLASQSYSPDNCRFMYCVPSNSAIFDITASYISNFGLLPALNETNHFSIYFFSVVAPIVSAFTPGKFQMGVQWPNNNIPIVPVYNIFP